MVAAILLRRAPEEPEWAAEEIVAIARVLAPILNARCTDDQRALTLQDPLLHRVALAVLKTAIGARVICGGHGYGSVRLYIQDHEPLQAAYDGTTGPRGDARRALGRYTMEERTDPVSDL